MTEILIKYRDGSGEITERPISDLRFENASTIGAFCHIRNARRPFKMDRIMQAVNPDTGEILNPYQLLAPPNGTGRPTLESLTWRALPAIKALKFFTLSTRGFRQRERDRVTQFAQEAADVSAYSREEVEEWVVSLWCGDLYAYRNGDTTEYAETLRIIPSEILDMCRHYALLIAGGSGRKAVDPKWVERIKAEFSPMPYVKEPEKVTDAD